MLVRVVMGVLAPTEPGAQAPPLTGRRHVGIGALFGVRVIVRMGFGMRRRIFIVVMIVVMLNGDMPFSGPSGHLP